MNSYAESYYAHTIDGAMKNRELETAYRRGFDQAIYFMLSDAGATPEEIHGWTYKRKIEAWRSKGSQLRVKRVNAPRQNCTDVHNFRDIIAKILLRPCNES